MKSRVVIAFILILGFVAQAGWAAQRPVRSSAAQGKIPSFDYRVSAQAHYLGFKPETDPARRIDEDKVERYAWSPHGGRDQRLREAQLIYEADRYERMRIPVQRQIMDILTYIPIPIGAER